MNPRRSLLLTAIAFTLLSANAALAQGIWFDIGSAEPTYVPCSTDDIGWEYFPAQPFGPYYPPGTLVYADMAHVGCAQLPQLGCDTGVVAGYWTYFNDGGCGCGGYLETTCRLRVHYDDAVVQGLGVEESDLLLVGFDWGGGWLPLEHVVIDTTGNFVEGDVTGTIIGDHYYAITTGTPTPVLGSSWGRVKALWR